jgi:DNA-binding GntR family transcriptional regulator
MAKTVVAEKRSTPDLVRDQLRQAILAGEFLAGEQLRQEELAERFGISRVPVREALRQLESEGLVELLPNRGAVVSAPSLADINELLEIRIGLECRALRLAIPNMIHADFEYAQQILDTYNEQDDPRRWSEMNGLFHATLYAPCNLPRMIQMIDSNYNQISLFVRSQISASTGKEMPQREHAEILAACRAGEVDRAVRLLEEHIVHTQKVIMAASRRRPAGS